jgi:hypothetical protein
MVTLGKGIDPKPGVQNLKHTPASCPLIPQSPPNLLQSFGPLSLISSYQLHAQPSRSVCSTASPLPLTPGNILNLPPNPQRLLLPEPVGLGQRGGGRGCCGSVRSRLCLALCTSRLLPKAKTCDTLVRYHGVFEISEQEQFIPLQLWRVVLVTIHVTGRGLRLSPSHAHCH